MIVVVGLVVVGLLVALRRTSHSGRVWPAAVGVAVLAGAAVLAVGGVDTGNGVAPEPAAFFTEPLEGVTVSRPVSVTMNAVHLGAGHFHVIVDRPCPDEGTSIPSDAWHLHFADGQATGTLDLAPGTHTMCLQVGDARHRARGAADSITVEVADGS